MRKRIILLGVLLFAFDAFCQNLSFLGIPIQGTKNEFFRKLKNNGFLQDTDTSFIGTFYSYDCIVKPVTNDKDEMVAVSLIIPPADSWTTLNVDYNVLRTKLKKEFGEESAITEEFDTPTKPSTNEEKYEALNNGKCQYMTTWGIDDGVVSLFINHWESGVNGVQVVYMKMDVVEPYMPNMKFKGIPFDNSADEFVYQLKKQGYRYVTRPQNDIILMKGDFAGYSECNIYIGVVLPDDVIGTVTVNFPDQNRWSHLHASYNNIKSMLIKKYGTPSSCIEEFDSYQQPTSEYDAMTLLKQDKYKYETKFYIEGGIIQLNISRIYVDYKHIFYVSLIYYDWGNQNKSKRNAIDDL